MTSKEKAIDIVIKMQFQREPLMFESAKQCAIIAVDEIIKANPYSAVMNSTVRFWQEVKTELEKL